MLHGHLLAGAAVLGTLVLTSVWLAAHEWRQGRRLVALILVGGAIATVASVGWYAVRLNAHLDQIGRITSDGLGKGERPEPVKTEDLTILLLGSDGRRPGAGQPDLRETLASGEDWEAGRFNSDTMMLVRIPADRRSVSVVSIPRDTYVPIYDEAGGAHSENKINSAFADYGPYGALRTVENLAGLRVDHLAIIDFQGFRELTEAVGGVRVYIPETFTDTQQGVTWEEGWTTLRGDRALQYVRTRHGLANGDFDRVDRQQNFLRALLAKVMADDTIGNPIKLDSTLSAITSHLIVDEQWSNDDLRGLAVSLRSLTLEKVRFATLPLSAYDEVPGVGSVNLIDPARVDELFSALGDNNLSRYLRRYPEDELKPPDEVR